MKFIEHNTPTPELLRKSSIALVDRLLPKLICGIDNQLREKYKGSSKVPMTICISCERETYENDYLIEKLREHYGLYGWDVKVEPMVTCLVFTEKQ